MIRGLKFGELDEISTHVTGWDLNARSHTKIETHSGPGSHHCNLSYNRRSEKLIWSEWLPTFGSPDLCTLPGVAKSKTDNVIEPICVYAHSCELPLGKARRVAIKDWINVRLDTYLKVVHYIWSVNFKDENNNATILPRAALKPPQYYGQDIVTFNVAPESTDVKPG